MDLLTRARDEWLALRCQAGEPGAFEALTTVLERPLLYYAIKLAGSKDDGLDVLQEAWLRALRDIRKLSDPGALRPWLYRIVHGAAIDRLRRDKARQRAEEVHSEEFDELEEPDFSASDAEAVHRGLDALDTAHREVLVLRFLEDFSLEEISAIVGVPRGTVKSRLHYAKKAMKEILTRGGYAIRQ